jgi:hypothetical protein
LVRGSFALLMLVGAVINQCRDFFIKRCVHLATLQILLIVSHRFSPSLRFLVTHEAVHFVQGDYRIKSSFIASDLLNQINNGNSRFGENCDGGNRRRDVRRTGASMSTSLTIWIPLRASCSTHQQIWRVRRNSIDWSNQHLSLRTVDVADPTAATSLTQTVGDVA